MNKTTMLVFLLTAASLFSSCGGRDALKGYEWLEGKWVDEGYLYEGYDHDYHSVIIAKDYFQSAASLEDDEMIIDPASKPKEKLSIKTTELEWLHGIKSIYDYYFIDEERKQIFWLYDFDIKHYMKNVSDGGSSPDASAGNGALYKNRKKSTKGWTERMNANNGLLVCRSNYMDRPFTIYYVFLPNPDSKDGCQGTMMVIGMEYIETRQSFTTTHQKFSATYEIRDGKVYFTKCYEWHIRNFSSERNGRKRIPDDFDGTWSVKDGVLKMETKLYDAQWSRWLDATLVEEDLHEYRLDGLRDYFEWFD